MSCAGAEGKCGNKAPIKCSLKLIGGPLLSPVNPEWNSSQPSDVFFSGY